MNKKGWLNYIKTNLIGLGLSLQALSTIQAIDRHNKCIVQNLALGKAVGKNWHQEWVCSHITSRLTLENQGQQVNVQERRG